MNIVILQGNLGRDPEMRRSQAGDPIANITVATNEGWGESRRTEWHRCVAFKKTAEACERFGRKGGKVVLRGRIQTRKWQDQSGQDRYSTEIVVDQIDFLDPREQEYEAPQERVPGEAPVDLDDEIPF